MGHPVYFSSISELPSIRDDDYTASRHLDLLKQAESQGHPTGCGSYLGHLTARQVDDLVHGRTDA